MFSAFCIILCLYLKCIGSHEEKSWNLFGKSGDGYYIAVEIGSPPQKFNLLVDTGSSNLAIVGSSYPGADSYFDSSKSSSYIYNGTSVKVIYSQGWWNGYLAQDLVHIPSIGSGSVLTDLSIMTHAEGVYLNSSKWQGILGLAYPEIAQPHHFVIPWFDSFTKTFPNITNDKFSLELCGTGNSKAGIHNGWFSVGGLNPICSSWEFSTEIHHQWFYEVLILRLDVGGKKLDIPCSLYNTPYSIIDSGTTNLQLSAKLYHYIIEEIRLETEKGGSIRFVKEFWEGKQHICFNNSKLPWFPHLYVYLDPGINDPFFIDIPPHSYLRPSPNNTIDINKYCYVFAIEHSHVGTVLGAGLLEGLCVTFDRRQNKIFFSNSSCGPNNIFSLYETKNESSSCKYSPRIVNGPFIATVTILLTLLLPLFLAFIRWMWKRYNKRLPGSSVPFVSLSNGET